MKEHAHNLKRAAARAAQSDQPGDGGPIFGSAPAEVAAVGTVLNPGDPGWQPHPDFLAAHPGWAQDDDGNWHPPTERN